MKQRRLLACVSLLLAAALLGWLLPSAVFWISDGIEEGKTAVVQTNKIDLYYQSDLDPASRLTLIRQAAVVVNTTPLDHGIYLQKQDVAEICNRFLQDLTNNSYPDDGRYEMIPMLLSFSEEGTMLTWNVSAVLDDTWRWEAMIDDQTGLILHCGFEGAGFSWSRLLQGYRGAEGGVRMIVSRISEALCRHFSERLSEDLTVEAPWSEQEGFERLIKITLSESGRPKYTIPLFLVLEEGIFTIN